MDQFPGNQLSKPDDNHLESVEGLETVVEVTLLPSLECSLKGERLLEELLPCSRLLDSTSNDGDTTLTIKQQETMVVETMLEGNISQVNKWIVDLSFH